MNHKLYGINLVTSATSFAIFSTVFLAFQAFAIGRESPQEMLTIKYFFVGNFLDAINSEMRFMKVKNLSQHPRQQIFLYKFFPKTLIIYLAISRDKRQPHFCLCPRGRVNNISGGLDLTRSYYLSGQIMVGKQITITCAFFLSTFYFYPKIISRC